MLAFEANTFVHAEDAGGRAPAVDTLHANMEFADSAVTETRMQHIKEEGKARGKCVLSFCQELRQLRHNLYIAQLLQLYGDAAKYKFFSDV